MFNKTYHQKLSDISIFQKIIYHWHNSTLTYAPQLSSGYIKLRVSKLDQTLKNKNLRHNCDKERQYNSKQCR
jgi:hypothetical protein